MTRKIKITAEIKTSHEDFPGRGLLGPQSQFQSNSLLADPNLHVPGERLFRRPPSQFEVQQCELIQ